MSAGPPGFVPLSLEAWQEHEAREHAAILADVRREVADLEPADREKILAAVRRQMAHAAEINEARVAAMLRKA